LKAKEIELFWTLTVLERTSVLRWEFYKSFGFQK